MPTVTRNLVLLTLSAAALGAVQLQAQRRSDVITAQEIDRVRPSVGTAYDAVRTLRPRWLRSREVALSGRPDDQAAAVRVRVYLNDVNVGTLEYLKTIPAEQVQELRWLSVTQAGTRYGPTDGPGIVVTLRR